MRVEGEAISDCVRQAFDAGELEVVGTSYVEAAEDLALEANQDDRAALQLGYLVGAVRAAAADTGGLHDELRRRLEQALPPGIGGSPAFTRGERAGRSTG